MGCLFPAWLAVVGPILVIVIFIFSYFELRFLIRRVLATTGLLVGITAVLISIPFGFWGVCLTPTALIHLRFPSSGGEILAHDWSIGDYPTFMVHALFGNLVLGWILGAIIDNLRSLLARK